MSRANLLMLAAGVLGAGLPAARDEDAAPPPRRPWRPLPGGDTEAAQRRYEAAMAATEAMYPRPPGAPPRRMPATTPEDHARLARATAKRARRAARRLEVSDEQ